MSGINVRWDYPPLYVICNTSNITNERGSTGKEPRMLTFILYYYTISPPSSPASNTIQRRLGHSTTVTAIQVPLRTAGLWTQQHATSTTSWSTSHPLQRVFALLLLHLLLLVIISASVVTKMFTRALPPHIHRMFSRLFLFILYYWSFLLITGNLLRPPWQWPHHIRSSLSVIHHDALLLF